MKNNIIKTDNYLLIVSDEIPTTWYYDTYLNKLKHTGGAEYGASSISKKVIGHLPLNNSPILVDVDLLPPLEDEVEKLAQKQWGNVHRTGVLGFIEGYNKAKEKYKYTEEDLRKAITMAREQYLVKYTDNDYDFEYKEDEIIQSLQQPKYPIGFECEKEWENSKGEKGLLFSDVALYEESIGQYDAWIKPKTTTNSQGQTQLIGKYIYE